MSMLTRRSSIGCLSAVLMIAVGLVGCGNKETWKALVKPPPSLIQLPSVQPPVQETDQLTPTSFVPLPLFYPGLDLRAGPVDVPLKLQIPSLKVNAPVLGVGLTSENAMDAPKGPIGDPVWHTAFWYRGSGIPGEPGTATFAGHVNDPLGQPEIFAHLQKLHPGDLIIVHVKNNTINIRFNVDHVKVYSTQSSSDPAVLAKIFGTGPLDGLSHLTLITCAGIYVNGQYNHHIVVYATRSK